jgi:preprotein translocase subunit SecD
MHFSLQTLKNTLVILVVMTGVLFFVINSFGQKFIVKVVYPYGGNDVAVVHDVMNIVKNNHLAVLGAYIKGNNVINLEFSAVEEQIKARDILQKSLGETYDISLNLLPNVPNWLQKIGVGQMPLGLDLRGGVHFLLQLDNQIAIKKHLESNASRFKYSLFKDNMSFTNFVINNYNLSMNFADANIAKAAYEKLSQNFGGLKFILQNDKIDYQLNPNELAQIAKYSLQQNLLILHNRVNALGVAEPIIQQQGNNRIMVELPGIQDIKRAKNILGRIVSLEVHLVNEQADALDDAIKGKIDVNNELLYIVKGDQKTPVLINKNIELTGDTINDARVGFDEEGLPAVNLSFNDLGAGIFKKLTGNNIGKRIALVIDDNGSRQVVTAPVVRSEIGGGQVQISGSMAVDEAEDIALLLRSGSLATPMSVVQEQIVGPSLGHDNILRGIYSVTGGFVLLMLFMCYYYRGLGVVAVISLSCNLLVLVLLLSLLHATLTLSGVVAMALTLGVAIDANVLINESIKEYTQQKHEIVDNALEAGYHHAWATIVDSNITIFIVGIALFAFASGSIKGFAVVHCLGILSSIFSIAFVTRPLMQYFGKK